MFTTRPELQGSVGMVASTHWLASAAGMALLEAGGNAFDAAAATGLTLEVVEPHLNGPGGDLPLLFAGPNHPPTVFCAQGTAPAGATIEHYRGAGLDLIPGSGLLAAAIPGAVTGWFTLVRDHGTATLRQITDAAIHYAATGFPVLPAISRTIATVADLFTTEWPTSAAAFLADGRAPEPGTWLRNEAWAATLQRLVSEAEAASPDRDQQFEHALHQWTSGFVAAEIDAFVRTPLWDSSGRRHAGVLTADDLATWRPSYEAPVSVDFRGWTVCKTGAWGQGPALLQQLTLLDGFDLVPGTAQFVHTVVECAKLAFADREAWYGDDSDVPLDTLLSAAYAAERRQLVTDTAADGLHPGNPDGRTPRLPRLLAAPKPAGDVTSAEPTVSRTGEARGDTVHVSVADRFGNLVAATPSGGWLHSSPVIPALGFPLGTRVQMMWLEDGLPNSLRPGRRPRTTLSPSLALRDGEPVLAFGTPGGDQQDQWQLGFFLNHAVAGMDLQQAIDAPAFHSTHFPSSFYPRESYPRQVVIEDRFGPDVLDDLRRRGHDIVESGPWTLGRMSAVARDGHGRLRAAANPRGMQGYAVGR